MSAFKDSLIEVRVIATIIGVILVVGWVGSLRTCSHRGSQQTVTQTAEHLDAQVERGRYRRVAQTEITETDAWGRRLQVEYRDEGLGERLVVSSAGRDGRFGTEDDIVAKRWLVNAKGIGERIHDGAGSTAQEATKGVIRGAKEEVKDSFRRVFRRDEPTR
ncbi:MAG: hypothetical protein ACO1QR_15730 [Chthoniobacteraceae bacterium]